MRPAAARRQIGVDFRRVQRAHEHRRGDRPLDRAGQVANPVGRDHLVTTPGQSAQHGPGVALVERLAENRIVDDHGGVGPDHRQRPALGGGSAGVEMSSVIRSATLLVSLLKLPSPLRSTRPWISVSLILNRTMLSLTIVLLASVTFSVVATPSAAVNATALASTAPVALVSASV